jgi:hypothetical protein
MGTMHMTNRGLATLTIAMWNVPADIGVGLLVGSSIPAAIDTGAEIYDFNFVSELLAATGVDEPTDGTYARVNPLTLGTAAEDDTNDRINYPANDANFGALTNTQTYGAFIYVDGASDAARVLLAVDLFTAAVTANGAGFVYQSGGVSGMADMFRLQR